MRFTAAQCDEAIENLTLAKAQLAPDGHPCAVCGCSSHMAFECGHNPLVAMAMCRQVATAAAALHEATREVEEKVQAAATANDKCHALLHWFAGYDTAFGVQRGPAKVVLPTGAEAT